MIASSPDNIVTMPDSADNTPADAEPTRWDVNRYVPGRGGCLLIGVLAGATLVWWLKRPKTRRIL